MTYSALRSCPFFWWVRRNWVEGDGGDDDRWWYECEATRLERRGWLKGERANERVLDQRAVGRARFCVLMGGEGGESKMLARFWGLGPATCKLLVRRCRGRLRVKGDQLWTVGLKGNLGATVWQMAAHDSKHQ